MDIPRSTKQLNDKNIDLHYLYMKKVGDGKDTWFWDDNWIGDGTLEDWFNRIFRLDREDQVRVENCQTTPIVTTWMRRLLRGGPEQEQWFDFQLMV